MSVSEMIISYYIFKMVKRDFFLTRRLNISDYARFILKYAKITQKWYFKRKGKIVWKGETW